MRNLCNIYCKKWQNKSEKLLLASSIIPCENSFFVLPRATRMLANRMPNKGIGINFSTAVVA